MILTIETALHGIARILRERIAPAVQDPFAGEAARLAELLLTLNANWVDDAVAIRVAENAAIRSLFAEAGPMIADAELAQLVAAAARSEDPGLRISELDRESCRLRTLLADLDAHLDAQTDPSARELAQRIWRLLERFEAARAPRG